MKFQSAEKREPFSDILQFSLSVLSSVLCLLMKPSL